MFGKADKYVGNLALGMAKKALSLINAEKKVLDVQYTAQSVTDAGLITQLTNISQGTSDITRVGNSMKIMNILFRYQIRINATATKTLCRCILVQDKQTNGAIFTLADLLQDATINDSIVSPLNLDNRNRFRILYDKCIPMNVTGSNACICRKKFMNKQIHIKYDGNAGTIADLSSNSLAFVCISNEATNAPVVTFYNRIRFVDN